MLIKLISHIYFIITTGFILPF